MFYCGHEAVYVLLWSRGCVCATVVMRLCMCYCGHEVVYVLLWS